MLTLFSNRQFIIKIILIGLIPSSLFSLFMGIGFLFTDTPKDILPYFIIFLSFTIIFVCILLCVIFSKRKKFIFSEHEIIIINKETITLNVEDLEEMTYYQYKWWYFLILSFTSLPNGGCMKIHVFDKKSNKKYFLGFFSLKQALEIKKLYPQLKIK